MVKVKVCGITRMEDLHAAVAVGVDYLGFVVDTIFSPRNLPLHRAKTLMKAVPEGVTKVAVTIYRSWENIEKIALKLGADYVQVHGDLTPILEQLPNLTSVPPLIGAVDATSPHAQTQALQYSQLFDLILLDSADGGYGGTGRPHDWKKSRRIRDSIHPKHMILAGGLTEENVGEAIRTVRPHGVDVSTGVEKDPGIKDHKKISDFMRRVVEVTI